MSELRGLQSLDASYTSFLRGGVRDEGVTRTALFEYPIQLNIGCIEFQVPIKAALNLGGDDLVLLKASDNVG